MDTAQIDFRSSVPKHCDVQPQYVYESTIHSQNLLSTLNEQRKTGLLCDITVIVEGVELLAHKAVLSACSTYFSGIITDPANVSHNIVLELSSITKIGMENLLEFAYTSKLTVSKDNIDHVLSAARELEMKNLEYSCLNFLKQKLLETTETSISNSCVEGKSVCKNSTISRKLVSSNVKNDNLANVACLENNTVADQSPGDCPLMAQLSLNPKPIPSQHKLVSSYKSAQPCKKSLASIGSFPKAEPLFYPHLIPQQQCLKSDAVTKMMTMPFCSPNANTQVVCIPTQISSHCKPKYSCSPPYNSDTDEALSADEETDRNYKCPLSANDFTCKSKKYPDIELPLSVEEITKLPRSELQELLNKHPHLSVQQISAINEIRRRGKNRIAAQRCRKRKMDCIRALQCELESLHKDYNELMAERRCVRENMFKLVNVFQQRYAQVFCDIVNPCVNQPPDKSASVDQAVLSMAQFFKNEVEQASKVAEQLSKLPCANLPPLNFPCLTMNPEIVVVCDEEEKSSNLCYKPCSPGVGSTTSFSSDVTDITTDSTPMQDVTCSNTFLVQPHNLHATESSEESQGSNIIEKRSHKQTTNPIDDSRT